MLAGVGFVRVSVYVIQVSRWARLRIHVQLLHIPVCCRCGLKGQRNRASKSLLATVSYFCENLSWLKKFCTGDGKTTTELTLYADDTVCYVDGWGRGIRIDVFLFFPFFCGPVSDETIITWPVIVALSTAEQMSLHLQCDLYLTVSTIWLQCGSFHLNHTTNSVLANKGVELKGVFSLKVDALIFPLWSLNLLWGWKGNKKKKCVSKYFIYIKSLSSKVFF